MKSPFLRLEVGVLDIHTRRKSNIVQPLEILTQNIVQISAGCLSQGLAFMEYLL